MDYLKGRIRKSIINHPKIILFIQVISTLILSGYVSQLTVANPISIQKSWVVDTKGCKFWSLDFEKVSWSWSGKCVDGYVDGLGILQQHVVGMNDGDLYRYEGNFVHGIQKGKGEYSVGGRQNGYTVEGYFDNGVINGPCKYKWKTGAQFEGTCKNDLMDNGIQVASDGTVLKIVHGEQGSSSHAGNTSSGHVFGTIFKAVAGAVVSTKTGDSTLLNQAVQEANGYAVNSSQSSVGGIIVGAEAQKGQTIKNQSVGESMTTCVGQVVIQPKYNGDLSGTKGITNNCNFPISVHWCVDGHIMNAAGLYTDNPNTSLCSAHYLGQYSLEPQEIKSLGINGFDTFRVIACKKPYRAINPMWQGNKFSDKCIYSPIGY